MCVWQDRWNFISFRCVKTSEWAQNTSAFFTMVHLTWKRSCWQKSLQNFIIIFLHCNAFIKPFTQVWDITIVKRHKLNKVKRYIKHESFILFILRKRTVVDKGNVLWHFFHNFVCFYKFYCKRKLVTTVDILCLQ